MRERGGERGEKGRNRNEEKLREIKGERENT